MRKERIVQYIVRISINLQTNMLIRTLDRCSWVGSDEEMIEYHDNEWGIQSSDDRHLFEALTLEGAQAGLSWATILRKRSYYREAFLEFDFSQVAKFNCEDVHRLLNNSGIIRNTLKIKSVIKNAKSIVAIRNNGASFADTVWYFGRNAQVVNRWQYGAKIPTETMISKKMSKYLKKIGFAFVGPTICYSFMQAIGMVDDHERTCFKAAF